LISLSIVLIYCQALCCRTPLVESVARTFIGNWKTRIQSCSLKQKFELLDSTHSLNKSIKGISTACTMPKSLRHKVQQSLWNLMISEISAPLPKINVDIDIVNVYTEIDTPEPMQMLFESHNEDLEGLIDMDSAFTEDLTADFNMALDDSEEILFDENDNDHDVNNDELFMDLNVGECDAQTSANLVIDDEEMMIW
jgi:hypothetical protein